MRAETSGQASEHVCVCEWRISSPDAGTGTAGAVTVADAAVGAATSPGSLGQET